MVNIKALLKNPIINNPIKIEFHNINVEHMIPWR